MEKKVDNMLYMPSRPMMMPAVWLIVSMWRGRNRRRKRLMTHARKVHQKRRRREPGDDEYRADESAESRLGHVRRSRS